jgi:hypothetical protein
MKEIDTICFSENQKLHDDLKYKTAPYNTEYYDVILKKYLKTNTPNEFILVNFFSKLYCWTFGEQFVIKIINEYMNYFKHITITQDLLNNIFKNIKSHKICESTPIPFYNDYIVIYRSFKTIEILLLNNKLENLILSDVYEHIKLIDFEKNREINLSKDIHNVLSNIFEIIYSNNKKEILSFDVISFIYKHKLIKHYICKSQSEYELSFKYLKKIDHTKFIINLECLENACCIKNNTTMISKIMTKFKINPSSKCLENALLFIDNTGVIKLLLTKNISASKEQILQYCKLKNDSVMELLVNSL